MGWFSRVRESCNLLPPTCYLQPLAILYCDTWNNPPGAAKNNLVGVPSCYFFSVSKMLIFTDVTKTTFVEGYQSHTGTQVGDVGPTMSSSSWSFTFFSHKRFDYQYLERSNPWPRPGLPQSRHCRVVYSNVDWQTPGGVVVVGMAVRMVRPRLGQLLLLMS